MDAWEILKWLSTFLATAGALIAFAEIAIKRVNRKSTEETNKRLEELKGTLDSWIERSDERFEKIDENLRERDIERSRVELNSFLNKVKYHREEIDQQEWQLYYAIYDRYTNKLHENSYIHAKWERIVNGKDKADSK